MQTIICACLECKHNHKTVCVAKEINLFSSKIKINGVVERCLRCNSFELDDKENIPSKITPYFYCNSQGYYGVWREKN